MRILILASLFLCSVWAEKKNAIQRFGDSDLPVIRTKVRFTTMFLLPEGDEISEVSCGDKEYWVIEGKGTIVHVKPAKEGVVTNLNIVTKNQVIYSFVIQEVTKPGKSNEKPDLKVVLGPDETVKLRKEKENLEEVLARTERALKETTDKNPTEQDKKKDEAEPPVVQAISELRESPRLPEATKAAEPAAPPVSTPAEPVPPPITVIGPPEEVPEEPLVSVYTVERKEGFIRKGAKALGRFFKRVSRTLRLY